MTRPALTDLPDAICNPENPAHFMRIKPVGREVGVFMGQTLLARSSQAHWLLEVGRDLYDPVIYVPREDVAVPLDRHAGKTTHCPLKGEASYYSLQDDLGKRGADLVWAYENPYDFASALAGLVAFDPRRVRLEIAAANN